MDRPEAIVYLNGRFNTLMDALGIRAEDSPRGLGPTIDGAYWQMGSAFGTEFGSTIPPEQDHVFSTLLRYHFLSHALERAAVLVDIRADDPLVEAKRSQMFNQIGAALKVAQGEADAVIVDPETEEMQLFRLNLDWVQDAPLVP